MKRGGNKPDTRGQAEEVPLKLEVQSEESYPLEPIRSVVRTPAVTEMLIKLH